MGIRIPRGRLTTTQLRQRMESRPNQELAVRSTIPMDDDRAWDQEADAREWRFMRIGAVAGFALSGPTAFMYGRSTIVFEDAFAVFDLAAVLLTSIWVAFFGAWLGLMAGSVASRLFTPSPHRGVRWSRRHTKVGR